MSDSKGIEKFKAGFNCAQSVLFHFCDKLDLSEDTALKLGSGFGAGIARTQQVCGAVSGAVLVLNSLYGHGENDGPEVREALYSKIQKFNSAFEARFGTTGCKDLLEGCELLTKEGQKRFGEEKMIYKCYSFVDGAIEILKEMVN